MKTFLFLSALVSTSFLTGCETTGDPTQGGIFWSPAKADQRIYQRERALNTIENDTDALDSRNRSIKRQIEQ